MASLFTNAIRFSSDTKVPGLKVLPVVLVLGDWHAALYSLGTSCEGDERAVDLTGDFMSCGSLLGDFNGDMFGERTIPSRRTRV
jgi:hypothetical protein